MKPLIVLIAVFIIATIVSRLFLNDWNLPLAGNIAMCFMLFLTASGHVLFTKGMEMMLPTFVPFKTFVIYFTGIAEVLLGIALLISPLRSLAGVALLILFGLMLPANIYAAMKHIDIEKATYTGPGLGYLWFRIPLQILFIAWVFYFSI
ncbi:MAG: hypothetical protein V4560_17900 [Bacteroidota bacterium]